MNIPLEDQLPDILGKAQRGLSLDDRALAERSGVPANALARLKTGAPPDDSAALERIANALGLHAPALLASARAAWRPEEAKTPSNLAVFNTPFGGDMSVNSFLVWDRPGGIAVLFDTGTDAKPALATLQAEGLRLEAVFLTHTHDDHIHALDAFARTDAEVFVPERERHALPKAMPVTEGQRFSFGGLKIDARLTRGHTAGGLTYVVEIVGSPSLLAIVGDALFAGSQGGVPPELYAEALRLNRENILGLPDNTIICPGHGPLTTVSEEKTHNPFYVR